MADNLEGGDLCAGGCGRQWGWSEAHDTEGYFAEDAVWPDGWDGYSDAPEAQASETDATYCQKCEHKIHAKPTKSATATNKCST